MNTYTFMNDEFFFDKFCLIASKLVIQHILNRYALIKSLSRIAIVFGFKQCIIY